MSTGLIYIPTDKRILVPSIQRPVGWVETLAALNPVVWARLNTASGTENNLGSGGGALSFGSSVTRNASGGPVAGSGYASTAASSGQSFIRSAVATMWTTFTAGVWVKFPASGNTQAGHSPTIISKRQYYASATNAFPFYVVWDQTNGRIAVITDAGTDYASDHTYNTANGSFSTGEWTFLVVVVRPSGGAIDIYKNGSSLVSYTATTTCSTSSTAPKWGVAASDEYGGGAGNSECLGDWSEFFVCSSALSATQIANLYNSRSVP